MAESILYDDDILLWSERQAELIRKLGTTRRDFPNDFDVENVAEEIESVGRSELASVENLIYNILIHRLKLSTRAESAAARHWRGEIISFHGEVQRRYAPSMRQRITLERLWTRAREQLVTASKDADTMATLLPHLPPFTLDDFLGERIDTSALVSSLRASGTLKPLGV